MPITFPFDKFEKSLIKVGLKEANYNQNLSEWTQKHGDTEQSRKDFLWQWNDMQSADLFSKPLLILMYTSIAFISILNS
jgi:hypothetical protein